MKRHLSSFLALAAAAWLAGTPAAFASGQAFVSGASFGFGQAFTSGGLTSDTSSDEYAKGTQALDGQRWQDAIASFDKVVKAHDKRADAALYWKAYALNKLSRPSLVSATCNQLRGSYPRSSWNRDCGSLYAAAADPGIYVHTPTGKCIGCVHPPNTEHNGVLYDENNNPIATTNNQVSGAVAQFHGRQSIFPNTPEPPGSDADLKMLALNSVLQRDPAQALPMIRTILTGDSSTQLKHRALTTLGMSQSPDAQSLLRDVALGKIAPTEQRQAIQMLGAFQGKRAGDTLAEIYRTSADRNIKRTALSGLFVAGDAPRMVELARNEKDLQLKHDIVAQLALMHDKAATDYMLELLK